MTTIWLTPELASLSQEDDNFDRIFALQGETYRQCKNRRTFRFEHLGKGYFVKCHAGSSWREIIKNLLRLRLPVLGAQREIRALQTLPNYHIPTMKMVGYGYRGCQPTQRQSFVITEAMENTLDLERFTHTAEFQQMRPAQKRLLIKRLSHCARRFHQAGFVHYDFYLCHFLLDLNSLENPHIAIIDCHRVQQYRRLPKRHLRRDLAALLFSSLDLPVTQRDRYRFLIDYFGCSLRECFQRYGHLLKQVERRAKRLTRKVHGRDSQQKIDPQLPLELKYLDLIFAQQGDYIATSTLNDTYPYPAGQAAYYVKRYYAGGKGLRRWLGRSRLQAEVDNLGFFRRLGLCTPEIANFSLQKRFGLFKRGVLITKAVNDVTDLKTLKRQQPLCFQQTDWRLAILFKLAEITRQLHAQGFIHTDLKWRNLLVSPGDKQKIVMIDCPSGQKRRGHWVKRGIIKDLMSLDKEANGFLSKTDRLRFYLHYQNKSKLDATDKRLIKHIFAAYR